MKYKICHDCSMDTDDWTTESRATGDYGMGYGMYTYSDFAVHNDRRLCKAFQEMRSRVLLLETQVLSLNMAKGKYEHAQETLAQHQQRLFEPVLPR